MCPLQVHEGGSCGVAVRGDRHSPAGSRGFGGAPQTPVHHKVLQFPGIVRPEEYDFADDVLKMEKGA